MEMWVVIAGLAVMMVFVKLEVRRLNRRIDRVAQIMIATPIVKAGPSVTRGMSENGIG